MAVPDPYKATVKKPANTVPTNGGTVPAPTNTTPKATVGVIGKASNTPIPNPSAAGSTVSETKFKPIVAKNSVPTPPSTPKSSISTPEYTDWLSKQNEMFSNLEKLVNTPFSYDPNTDPGYQAQRELAQLRAVS